MKKRMRSEIGQISDCRLHRFWVSLASNIKIDSSLRFIDPLVRDLPLSKKKKDELNIGGKDCVEDLDSVALGHNLHVLQSPEV